LKDPFDIAICFGFSLCCAAISWHLVEHPVLQLKSGAHVR
jgi:peptidoglycan/LPS O-acetylase OafA/YrhL